MKLTWLGCASVRLDCGNKTLWVDPFMSINGNADNPADEATFADAHEILITHGHFDHLMSIPEFNAEREIRVHCTDTPRETLLKCGIPEQRIRRFAVGEAFELGDTKISVFQGQHNKIDMRIALQTALRVGTSIRRAVEFMRIVAVHKSFPEADETVLFEVQSGGERVQIMGSLGLRENVARPELGADVLVLPFNGTSNPTPMAMRIVEAFRPKSVLLSHFDNAFPPMTSSVDLAPFISAMREKCPEIPVLLPKFGETVSVSAIKEIAAAPATEIRNVYIA
ncbi:MAG: MBL fold metallo-hydrolase [Oscillospiraceae bacterium]|jgi:L-ascorbate metabolism protein UlaG (beta-lactamase superfamily)|nr:MBL fold metallo-hydrolase [Oscillospiraceae bacterium]